MCELLMILCDNTISSLKVDIMWKIVLYKNDFYVNILLFSYCFFIDMSFNTICSNHKLIIIPLKRDGINPEKRELGTISVLTE